MYLSTFTGLLESCVGGGAVVVLAEKIEIKNKRVLEVLLITEHHLACVHIADTFMQQRNRRTKYV